MVLRNLVNFARVCQSQRAHQTVVPAPPPPILRTEGDGRVCQGTYVTFPEDCAMEAHPSHALVPTYSRRRPAGSAHPQTKDLRSWRVSAVWRVSLRGAPPAGGIEPTVV